MTTTRRVFLKVVGAGSAVSACGLPLFACAGPGTGGEGEGEGEAIGDIAPGTKADAVPDGLHFLTGQSVILGKDAGGLYAMTSICTHLHCDITVSGVIASTTEIDCNCHGSKYDENGAVTFGAGGPSQPPLNHLKVTIAADKTFTVDEATTVDASERAAIPA